MVDSSAWIEYLRRTGSSANVAVREALATTDLALCEAVVLEILAGARDDEHLAQLRGLLARAQLISIVPDDYEHGAALYRACRRRGETVRKMLDCLIAAVAIRAGVPVLHADADFATLARYTALQTHPASAA